MSGDPRKSRENVLSVALKGSALEAMELLLDRFPGRDNKSQVYRKIIDVGIRALAANPALMFQATTPTPEEVKALLEAAGSGASDMLSPVTGTPIPGGMTTGTFVASGGPILPPPAPEPPTDETPPPAPPPAGPKPRKPRDPSKPRRSRKDPMREPTDDELDRYRKRSR